MQLRSTAFSGTTAAWLIMALSATAVTAAPVNDVYTIANFPVEATAADAVAAKSQAIAQGEAAALRSLLKRLVPTTAYSRLRALEVGKADALVDGISVRSERNSSTRYVASLDFRFRADAVRALLDRARLPYVESQAPALTVVPIFVGGPTALPGADAAAWKASWTGLDLVHALAPVRLEDAKPGVHPDTIAALSKGDTTMLHTFAAEYGGEDRLVAAIAEPKPAERKLAVTLVGHDMVGSITWVKTYRLDADDPSYAMEQAAIVSLGVLEGRWKSAGAQVRGAARDPGDVSSDRAPSPTAGYGAPPAGNANSDGVMRLAVQFRDIAEWAEISRRLGQVDGVQDIDVAGLGTRSARISLRFPGPPEELANAVRGQGLELRNSSAGWILTRL